MSNEREVLEDKFKTLPLEDLLKYRSSAKIMNKTVNVAGIGTILFVITFTNLFTILIGTFLVYVASKFSVGINEILSILQEHLERRFPDK